MPKVTLKTVQPYVTTRGEIVCNNEQDTVIHSELISLITPYYNPQVKAYVPGVNMIYLKDMLLLPIFVKQPYAQLVAIMNENAYHPVSVGSGDTLSDGGGQEDDGGDTGTGNTGSAAFRGSNSTTFNGACVAATNNDYKHNGSSTLPVAGNKVFLNDGTTLLNDGYYGIAATGSTASAMIRVNAGFVASGYPIQCQDLDQIYE